MIAVCCEMERLAKLKMARIRDVVSGSIAKLSPYGICRVCQVSNARGCSRSYVVLWKCLTPILWSLGNFVALVACSHNDFLSLANFYCIYLGNSELFFRNINYCSSSLYSDFC
jgi:hypothetical protein